jgi:hypothetical protein
MAKPFLGGLVKTSWKRLTGLLGTPAPVRLFSKPVQGEDRWFFQASLWYLNAKSAPGNQEVRGARFEAGHEKLQMMGAISFPLSNPEPFVI